MNPVLEVGAVGRPFDPDDEVGLKDVAGLIAKIDKDRVFVGCLRREFAPCMVRLVEPASIGVYPGDVQECI